LLLLLLLWLLLLLLLPFKLHFELLQRFACFFPSFTPLPLNLTAHTPSNSNHINVTVLHCNKNTRLCNSLAVIT
jgi:hypothetical protein